MQRKLTCLFLSALLLLSGLSLAWAEEALPMEAAAYVPALEAALEEHYGPQDTWPATLTEIMAGVKHFSGVAPSDEYATIETSEDRSLYVDGVYEAMHTEFSSGHSWPYELHALWGAVQAYTGVNWGEIPVLYGEGDLPEAEALAIAREAVQTGFNLSDEEVNALEAYGRFFLVNHDRAEPYWYVVVGLRDDGFELYIVEVTSPDGMVPRTEQNEGLG